MSNDNSITRRGLLGAGAAAGAVAAVSAIAPASAQAAEDCRALTPGVAKAPAGGRIDLHAHHIPPVYRQALLEARMLTIGGYPTPVWTPELAMDMMDRYGIQMQVLSLSDPGVSFLKGDAAKRLARQCNEYTAQVIRDHPTRFGGFAVLPLPDIAASLEELAYALDVLKLDGVSLLTSYDGANVALPQFELLWAELNRRKAFVFMHPATLAADDKPSYVLPDFLVEFTFETTRFVTVALNTGLTTLFPNLRIQLAHAGGAYPFLSYRAGVLTEGGLAQVTQDRTPDLVTGILPVRQIKGLFYDTALNPAPAAMRAILEISDVNHIVFGSDWPFTQLLFLTAGDPQPQLSRTFDQEKRHAIERANALAQLPSLAARLGIPEADTRVNATLVRARDGRNRNGRRRLRMTVDAREPAMIDARLVRGRATIASKRFDRVDRGRRDLDLGVPRRTAAGGARLVLEITDPLGNTRTNPSHRAARWYMTRARIGPDFTR